MPYDAPDSSEAIGRYHRHCAAALANIRLLVDDDDVTVVEADTVREMDRVVQRVLEELHAAERRVLDELTGTARKRPATRLLRGRFHRLERAGAHVVVAVHDGNVPMLRRTLTRFDALARATCAVQLDIYRSALSTARRPRRPMVWQGVQKSP